MAIDPTDEEGDMDALDSVGAVDTEGYNKDRSNASIVDHDHPFGVASFHARHEAKGKIAQKVPVHSALVRIHGNKAGCNVVRLMHSFPLPLSDSFGYWNYV